MTYMLLLNCALKLVEEIIQYYRCLVKFYPYPTRTGLLVSLPETLNVVVSKFL